MTASLGLLGGGASWSLVGVADRPQPAQLLREPRTRPKHDTTVKAFGEAQSIAAQMANQAKVCGACGKNCADIPTCNGCGASLASTPLKSTENVVMGFVYGVAKTEKGPLPLSLRYEDAQSIVYDDPLARSAVHLNAVPTDMHLPDWRWLLTRPLAALALLERLRRAADAALETAFWSDESWRTSYIRPGAVASLADLQRQCILALNAAPSQYQLHLHYICPPLLPHDYHLLLCGERFSRGRWLPLEYLDAALSALAASERRAIADAPDLTTEACLAALADAGAPDYDAALDAALARYAAAHEALANWPPDAFTYLATRRPAVADDGAAVASYDVQRLAQSDGADVPSRDDGVAGPPPDLGALLKRDKVRMAAYGRPFDEAGKQAPAGYYAHAKTPGEVVTAAAWAQAADG